MTEIFTASNGIGVELGHPGVVILYLPDDLHVYLTPEEVIALREFFQHERDEELGRWRWPENREYIVYPRATGSVDVLRESSVEPGPGIEEKISRIAAQSRRTKVAANFYAAASAYFDAHPDPKPWHDAKHDEIWAIRFENAENFLPFRWDAGESAWFNSNANMAMHYSDERKIVSARRIWPEESAA